MAHAYRIASEAIELLSTGKMSLPCLEVGLIKKIRSGALPIEEVETMIENKLNELNSTKGILPDQPDLKFAKSFVIGSYQKAKV